MRRQRSRLVREGLTCAFLRCSQNGFLGFDGGPDVTRRLFTHPFAAGVGDSQDEVSKMKKKIAVRTAIAS
ncbi:MAG: hypothetical protein EOO27_23220, partial [Comamonadaceae bacterium]